MKKELFRKAMAYGIIVLFVGASVVPGISGNVSNLKKTRDNISRESKSVLNRGTLYVGGSGPGNYSSIQDAVDDANDGDTIFVYDDSSPYYENVVVDKSINLIGEDRDTTIIDSFSPLGTVRIAAHWVKISGFKISDGMTGIVLDGDWNTIYDNNIIGNEFGFDFQNADHNTIYDNNIMNNLVGIDLETECHDNFIYHNNFINNPWGNGWIDEWHQRWNDTYPSGGNYWDDHWNFIDEYSGPNQDIPGSDGIVDLPYFVGREDIDYYPFMNPYGWQQADLTLFIEDALNAGVIWKVPGDRVDIVFQVNNPTSATFSTFELRLEVSGVKPTGSYMGKVKCFIRNNFMDIAYERDITDYCVHDENSNIFTVQTNSIPNSIWDGIPSGQIQQFVFRVSIPENAPTDIHKHTADGTLTYTGGTSCSRKFYWVITDASGIIVTNRHVLFSRFGDDAFYYGGGNSADVEELINYLYDIAGSDNPGERKCIVYYVDHYDDLVPSVDLTHWDNHNDIVWSHPNDVHNAIDDLVEDFVSKTDPEYLMIVGGDEIIPFYRVDDTDETGDEINYPYNHDHDPILECASHNRYLSDVYYADTDHKDAWHGKVELSIGRVIGASASDMKKFIEHGIGGPEATNDVVVTSFVDWGWDYWPFDDDVIDTKDARNYLKNKWEIPTEDTFNSEYNWNRDDLLGALDSPFTILTMFNHGEYYYIECPNGDVFNTYYFPSVSDDKPLFFAVACRILPTDVDGQYWNPYYGDNLIYSAVYQGISGGFFSGGFAYYCKMGNVAWWGEKFGNEFFGKLVTSGQMTNPVGKAFKNAKRNYNPALIWDHKDTKTMREFNYYGVPWMKIPQCAQYLNTNYKGGEDSEIIFTVSDPKLLSNGNYSRTVQVNVTGYNISSFGGFDLIIINGTEQSGESLKPVVPFTAFPLVFPRYTNIANVEIIDNTSSHIGYYNLPCANESPDENGGVGVSNITDEEAYYPEQIYKIDITNFSEYLQLKIIFSPIKHNPNMDDTILYSCIMFNVTYNIPNPIALREFSIDDYFIMGEPIEGFVTVENVGSETLSGLRLNLSIEKMITGGSLFNLSLPFDLGGGESTEATATINELVPGGGSYFARVEIIDSDGNVLTCSHRDIFVSSGEIIEFNCPETVDPVALAQFSILFKNNNVSLVSAKGVIRVYDSNYRLVAELTSSPIDISSGSSEYIDIEWDTTGFDNGRYTISAMLDAEDETFRTSNRRLAITFTPNTPSLTGPTSGQPEIEYIYTTNTSDPDGDQVYYWFDWGDSTNSEWIGPYNSGDTCSASHIWSTRGIYYVKVKAKDIYNAESDWSDELTVIMDDIPPATAKTVGSPKDGEDDEWVTSNTEFNLTVVDNVNGSGVNKTNYRIWYNGSWTPWIVYVGNFTLTGKGKHYLEYYSTDNAGNIEDIHNQTHYVDSFTSVDDSYTDQHIPYRNYGTANTLQAYYSGGNFDRYIWLKFSLAWLSEYDIASATLKLHTRTSWGRPPSVDRIFGMHFSSNDTWNENTITWNNQPDFNESAEDTVTNPSNYEVIEFNITDVVQTEAAGDGYLTLVVKSEENTRTDYLSVYSKEKSEDLRAYLEIE